MTITISQQIFDRLTTLATAFELHISADKQICDKVNAMYKIIVTGNGIPSLPETVRIHDAWMNERKLEIEDERKSRESFHRQMIGLLVSNLLTFLLLGVAVYIGWR